MNTTKTKRQRLTVAQAEEIKSKLKAMPPIDKNKHEITSQAAVKLWRPEIEAMQKNGYTLEAIAERISSLGLHLTVPTLKSYLQRIKKEEGTTRPKAKGKADAEGSGNAA